MGIDDTFKSQIMEILMEIKSDMGGVKMFMEQSKLERNILFNKASENAFEVQELKNGGCLHLPEHKETCAVVQKHERAYQQACGIMWIFGVGTPIVSGIVAWIASNWHKLKGP